MPKKEPVTKHPVRFKETTTASISSSPWPTATAAKDESARVATFPARDPAQPLDERKPWQPVAQQPVVSGQLKKFLVTCLVVAGVGWLLAVVGICTDHWLSVSLRKFLHSGSKAVDTVTEVVTEGLNTVRPVPKATDTVKPGEVTQTPNVTDFVTATKKPSKEKDDLDELLDDVVNIAQKGLKEGEKAICSLPFISCRSLGTDRVHIGLFHCGTDCDGWMVGVQTLILTGFLLATGGMVLMTLHLVLKGRKPWMPTVGGVSCLIGGIFTVNGIIGYFLVTSYFDEPEWSFLVTFIGGLLFMVAGVLTLLLERHDRIQSRCEGRRAV